MRERSPSSTAIHKEGLLPDEVSDVRVDRTALRTRRRDGSEIVDRASLLVELGLATSKSEARRAFEQGAVRRDGVAETSAEEPWSEAAVQALVGSVWQIGKRRFARVAGLSSVGG